MKAMHKEGSDIRVNELPTIPRIESCIYFLISKNELIYIGKASELCSRVLNSQHHVFRKREVERVFYIQLPGVDSQELESIEKILIRRFAPRENVKISRPLTKDIATFQSVVGEWPVARVMEIFKENKINPFTTGGQLTMQKIIEVANLVEAKHKTDQSIRDIEKGNGK